MKKTMILFGVMFLMGCLGFISAQDDVMFNYQGRVKVQGSVFTGTGQFKFAIVNNPGNVSLWSNDSTSLSGAEPTGYISISVTDGIFNVMIGDTSLGMDAINRSVFNHPSQIKLRIWFSDGVHGFQQLLPDHKLVNVDLLGVVSGTDDFTIYVNGVTGDDQNNGLSPGKAKKTIQAAVDVLPGRLRCNVTIDIADGIYRESVNISGISVASGKSLTLLGNETWAPPTGDPSVRLTGTDDDVSHIKVRDYGIIIKDCSGVTVRGLLIDYFNSIGVYIIKTDYSIKNCKSSNNKIGYAIGSMSSGNVLYCMAYQNDESGFHTSNHATSRIKNTVSTYNGKDGYAYHEQAMGGIYDSIGSHNGANGLYLNASQMGAYGSCEFSNNTLSGIKIIGFGKIFFSDSAPLYYGQINNNSYYPMIIGRMSFSNGASYNNSYSGNSPSNAVYLYDNGYQY